mmetsp:Transcript_2421/g.4511  ORF Transcript_2421/g.4511 Transcript_2421/m.4511 type:complete len:86 (-) Transcript_2421:1780-2037(-)
MTTKVKKLTSCVPLLPNNVRAILPPSVLPTGSKLTALIIKPKYPAIAKGCRGMLISDKALEPKAASGTVRSPGLMELMIPPARLL